MFGCHRARPLSLTNIQGGRGLASDLPSQPADLSQVSSSYCECQGPPAPCPVCNSSMSAAQKPTWFVSIKSGLFNTIVLKKTSPTVGLTVWAVSRLCTVLGITIDVLNQDGLRGKKNKKGNSTGCCAYIRQLQRDNLFANGSTPAVLFASCKSDTCLLKSTPKPSYYENRVWAVT